MKSDGSLLRNREKNNYAFLHLRGLDTVGRLSAISAKGDNFRDFIFAFLHNKPFLKRCESRRVDLFSEGWQTDFENCLPWKCIVSLNHDGICHNLEIKSLKIKPSSTSYPGSQFIYRIYRMYSDRQAWANSVDPDETPQNAASHQGLHCLPLIQQVLYTTSGSKFYLFKF